MGKIVFLDIDGTIRDFSGKIPDSAVRSIQKARREGNMVCICTGRPLWMIEERILEIGFDGIISGAGTYVVCENECISYEYFTEELAHSLCQFFLEHGCIFEMQTYEKSYVLQSVQKEYQELWERMGREIGEVDFGSKAAPEAISDRDKLPKIEKMMYFSDVLSQDEVASLWKEQIYIADFSGPKIYRYGGELAPAGVNKMTGIQKFIQKKGYKQSDVIAIGDSENDMEMLQYASIGVAMGNATDKIKDVADMVTDTLLEDGLEKAFLKLGL